MANFTYNAKYKPNQLILGSGQTVVITGWTVKTAIARHLESHEYAAIGQLYSPTRGISFLIRNLLLNPHVHYLVVLNATREDKNAGGCQCLLDFFRSGFRRGASDTGKDAWVINSEHTGYLDIEIDFDALQDVRRFVRCNEAKNSRDAIHAIKTLAGSNLLLPWGEPREFVVSRSLPSVLPGPRYGHRIEGKTIAETWVKIIHRIKTTGTIRPTGYDGQWQELIDLMAIVTDEPEEFYFPEPNYLPINKDFLEQYIPQVVDDAPYQEGVKYTYGQRLRSWFGRDQIQQVVQKLIKEIDAASAVMSLWDVADHEKGGSPCLNHIWARVVDNELSLTAVFRSNDMFSAWPANAMGLLALQKHVVEQINQQSEHQLTRGPLITLSQSAHIYDDCWENAELLIREQYTDIAKKRDYREPVGNFLIEIADNDIMVTQTTPGSGQVVSCFSGKDPLKLIREICSSSPAIQAEHAGYLGIELQKAFECLVSGNEYNQDGKNGWQSSKMG